MATDQLDFDAVYDQYRPGILRYLQRMLGEYEAEDAAQDVFVRVSRSLGDFRGESSLSTWVYRIATNTAIDRLRRRRPHSQEPARPEPALVAVTDEDVWVSPAPPVETQAERAEMNECIRDYVEALPPPYRAVVVLSELEGMDTREMAAVLGVSPGAVKTRLHRARARLKQQLEDGCILYHDERNVLACEPRPPDQPDCGCRA